MPPLDKLQPLLVVKILRRACIVGCGDEQNERGMRGLVAHLARRTPPPLPSPPRSPSPPRRTRAAPEWKGHASPVAMSARRWRQCGRFPPLLRGDGRRALAPCCTHPSTERSSSIFGKLCEASSSILEGFGTYLVRPAAGLPLPSLRERRRRASQRVASQPSRPRASPGLVSARAVRARLRPSVSVRPEQEARTQVLVV